MIGLAALASFTLMAAPGAPPADFDARSRAAMNGLLREPDTARVELVAAPRYGSVRFGLLVGGYTGWFACYRVNARNGFGGYTGWETWAVEYGPDGQLLAAYPESYSDWRVRAFAEACAAPAP